MINMEIFGPILISFIAGLSTMIGSLIIFIKIKRVEEFITFCLSFSLSVMITLSIVDLIPSSSFIIVNNYGFFKGIIITALTFISGIIVVNFINKRIDKASSSLSNNNLYRVGILSMIALLLHNLPEGVATFMSAYKDINLGISLGIAIMMHNIPEGISIAVPLFYSTKSRAKGVLYTFISGIAEPIGAILTYIFLKNYINDLTIAYVLIIVGGIMISLAINKLLPEILHYNRPKYMKLGMGVGIILVLLNHFII